MPPQTGPLLRGCGRIAEARVPDCCVPPQMRVPASPHLEKHWRQPLARCSDLGPAPVVLAHRRCEDQEWLPHSTRESLLAGAAVGLERVRDCSALPRDPDLT